MNRTARRVIGVMLFAVVLYGVAALSSGVGKIAASLEHYAWWTFVAACALAFLNYVLRFLKWEYYLAVLEIRGIPKGESFLTFLSGFVLTVTPGKVGEVFKSLILFQLRGVPIQRTAPIVVAERVTDLIGVIVLISLGSVSFQGGVIWAAIGAAIVAVLLIFVATPSLSRRVLGLLPRLPGALGRVASRVVPKVDEALDNVRVLTTPGRLVLPTLLSILAWACECLGLWVIVGGFGGAVPGIPFTAFVYATATLAGALIPVPGGLGVTDGLIKAQLGLAGVAEGVPFASTLLVRFATLWFAVAVGFVALAVLRAIRPGLVGEGSAASPSLGDGAVPAPVSAGRTDSGAP